MPAGREGREARDSNFIRLPIFLYCLRGVE
jgi:hypothetical protein